MRRVPAILLSAALTLGTGCNSSRDRLLASLQSPRPEDRAAAVKKLAQKGEAEDLVLFTRAAKDTAAIVREEAAIALGQSQDTRVVDLLGELLGDPDDQVQAQAARALAQIKGDKAKAYLTLQYARRGRSTRQAIVDALKASNVPGAMAAVVAAESQSIWDRNLRALTDGSLPERVAAAEELGKSGRAEAVNRLIPLIKDSQVILAAAAVRGLGYAGDSRAVEPIASLLTENFPELREAATEALARLRDPRALPGLKETALERSPASSLATAAIIALPVSQETSQALCELTRASAPDDAIEAGTAMRARGGCPLPPVVEKLGRRGEQLDALRALQALGSTAAGAAPKLVPLISGSDVSLQTAAIRAASELGDSSAVEAIRKVHDRELERITGLRADWVASKPPPNPTAQPRMPVELVDDVGEGELALLSATVEALGRLKADGSRQMLDGFSRDPGAPVRASAFVGLAALGNEGLALAKEGLLDSAPEVRSRTARALAEQGASGQAALAELLPRMTGDRTPVLEAIDRVGPDASLTRALLTVLEQGGAEAPLAAQLLGRLKSKEAVAPLIRHLEDPGSILRRQALVALGRIGDTHAAEVIARYLNHDLPDVRAAAIEALAALHTQPRPDALDALKSDYYRRVREAVETSLTGGPSSGGTASPSAIEARTEEQ